MRIFLAVFLATLACLVACAFAAPRITVTADKKLLIEKDTGKPYAPWGFNYDRDYKSRLLEEHWNDEWPTVEKHFRQMKSMGANIVRIHLSVASFLESPGKPNATNVEQLKRLVRLCEDIGIYLDITGLGSYRKEAAPKWYVDVDELTRWAIQQKFWDVVAAACNNSPAIAWYDLVNEPIIPSDPQKPHEWMTGHLAEFWYCQFIVLDSKGRDRGEIARAWVHQMSAAIKKHSPDALITVGMLPFSSLEGQPSMGFDPPALKSDLDLICVHDYPKPPPFKDALDLLDRFNVGKPLVIEELFPMECKASDIPAFIEQTKKKNVTGWLTFFWGQTPAELTPATQPSDALIRDWLNVFQSYHP